MDYRVALDIYKGPLDLLLHLIQESEVDIVDIPIAKITNQYLRHLEVIQMLDPNVAGEFLVMASTLMEIKSRMLLPKPEKLEGQEDEGDPRIELIRQLMEYKRFKEAASLLADRREEHLDRFGRGFRQTFGEASDQDAVDLSEVSIWDILSAFDRIMRETLRMQPATIVNRDVPLRQHIDTLLRMLRVQGTLTFLSIFEACEDRLEAIGALLALLEMTRWRVIGLEQMASQGTILVKLTSESNVEKLMNALAAHPDLSAAPMEAKPVESAPAADATAPAAARVEPSPGDEAILEPASEPEPEPEPAPEQAPAYDDDEEPDEDLERIRKIQVRDLDLKEAESHEEPSDADSAPQGEEPHPAVAEGQEQHGTDVVAEDAGTPGPTVTEPPATPPAPDEKPAENESPSEDTA